MIGQSVGVHPVKMKRMHSERNVDKFWLETTCQHRMVGDIILTIDRLDNDPFLSKIREKAISGQEFAVEIFESVNSLVFEAIPLQLQIELPVQLPSIDGPEDLMGFILKSMEGILGQEGKKENDEIKREEEDSKWYILNEKKQPIKTPMIEANKWMQANNGANKKVAYDEIGEIRISTVFLSLDHNHSNGGPPVLWETMVFGILDEDGNEDEKQERYTSHEAALEGHNRWLEWVKLMSGQNQNLAISGPEDHKLIIDDLD